MIIGLTDGGDWSGFGVVILLMALPFIILLILVLASIISLTRKKSTPTTKMAYEASRDDFDLLGHGLVVVGLIFARNSLVFPLITILGYAKIIAHIKTQDSYLPSLYILFRRSSIVFICLGIFFSLALINDRRVLSSSEYYPVGASIPIKGVPSNVNEWVNLQYGFAYLLMGSIFCLLASRVHKKLEINI